MLPASSGPTITGGPLLSTTAKDIEVTETRVAVLIAIHGALLGLGLGLAWGVAGQRVLVAYGITALAIPWTTITTVVVGAIVVGMIAALLPSLRAACLAPTAISIE